MTHLIALSRNIALVLLAVSVAYGSTLLAARFGAVEAAVTASNVCLNNISMKMPPCATGEKGCK